MLQKKNRREVKKKRKINAAGEVSGKWKKNDQIKKKIYCMIGKEKSKLQKNGERGKLLQISEEGEEEEGKRRRQIKIFQLRCAQRGKNENKNK